MKLIELVVYIVIVFIVLRYVIKARNKSDEERTTRNREEYLRLRKK